eukprot:GHVS01010133.1.p1 GENE.GHVS01010133.1~~GHVS01010133.1.p1  ORF type:complete len:157 (+),score=50.85 GHVS01010133.1:53-472(+)
MAPAASVPKSNSSLPSTNKQQSSSSLPPPPDADTSDTTTAGPPSAGSSSRVALHVVFLESDGGRSTFKVSTRTKMCRVVEAYCGTRSYAKEGVRFVLHGKRLKVSGDEGQMTTSEAGIEDGDVIDVFRIQTGGSDWAYI